MSKLKKEGSVNEDKRVTAQEGDSFEVKSKTHRQKKVEKGDGDKESKGKASGFKQLHFLRTVLSF